MASETPTQPTRWEAAYLRFETPEQETRKFEKRLIALGAPQWPRDSRITELFCGRGNGLRALSNLGFERIDGIDLSPHLARQHTGPGRVMIGDCRYLPLMDGSRDVLIVQGGLHHLWDLPEDLDRTLAEAARVLRPGGRFVAVEPWLTPFLRIVHGICGVVPVRSLSSKIDALATMIDEERVTYERWLSQPAMVMRSFERAFAVERNVVGWGKLAFVGRPH